MAIEDDIKQAVEDAGAELFDLDTTGAPNNVELMDLEIDITRKVAQNLEDMGYVVEIVGRDQLAVWDGKKQPDGSIIS